jgi:hypothetical protein
MEPSRETPASPVLGPDTVAWGELVVQNGPLSGARRPLSTSLILIGHSESCDIRINVEGIDALHCAIARSQTGAVVRDLESETGTLVNGQHVGIVALHDGDLLSIGPCRLRLRLADDSPCPEPVTAGLGESSRPPGIEPTPRTAAGSEADALRIQIAAVVAQQAALVEEETRLQQGRVALDLQEAQLAAHLDEKRRRLLALRAQIHDARAEMDKERQVYQRQVAKMARELEAARAEVTDGQNQLILGRRRLVTLRRRWKRRWHQRWAGQRQELEDRQADIERQKLLLQREKEQLNQARLRLEVEETTARHDWQQTQDSLHQERETLVQWRQNREAEFQARVTQLDQRQQALASAELELAEQRRQAEARHRRLENEAAGLENRIYHQRSRLLELQAAAVKTQSLAPVMPSSPESAVEPHTDAGLPFELTTQRRQMILDRIAADLADQRVHLAEQCERWLTVRQGWLQDQATAAADLEAVGRRFQEWEEALASREADNRRSHEEAAYRHRHLEVLETQLRIQAMTRDAELDRLRADLRAREELIERRLAILGDLRRRWHLRYLQGVERLRDDHAGCADLRRQCTGLREELLRRMGLTSKEQVDLAARAVSLQQFRQKYLDKAADPAAAERGLERLRRRWAAIFEQTDLDCARQRHSLEAEAAAIDQRYEEMMALTEQIAEREIAVSRREMAREHGGALTDSEATQLVSEKQCLQVQAARYEEQLRELTGELERLARLLMEPTSAEMGADRQAA